MAGTVSRALTTACRCGCGESARDWFVPGHDTRLWARCLQEKNGDYVKATELYTAIRDGAPWPWPTAAS